MSLPAESCALMVGGVEDDGLAVGDSGQYAIFLEFAVTHLIWVPYSPPCSSSSLPGLVSACGEFSCYSKGRCSLTIDVAQGDAKEETRWVG